MIVVFGSINADLVTSVRRHPRDGETVTGSDPFILPGGKGANQALAAHIAGSKVRMVGAVGNDGFAIDALKNLEQKGVDLSLVEQTNDTTGLALIVVDDEGENTIVVTPGANASVKASQLDEQEYSLLITQNEINPDEVWKAHITAQQKGAVVVHNAAPAAPIPLASLLNIDHLIVNENEAIIVANSLGFSGNAPIEAAKFTQSKSQKAVIVTLGNKGAFAIDETRSYEVKAANVEVKDTTGAGDAFVGAFAAAIDRGDGLEAALQHGTIAGGLACQALGAQSSIPNAKEIAAYLGKAESNI